MKTKYSSENSNDLITGDNCFLLESIYNNKIRTQSLASQDIKVRDMNLTLRTAVGTFLVLGTSST